MKKLSTKQNLMYSILSGVLLALAFPPMPLPLLAFAGLVPILFIFSGEENPRFKYLYVYLTFFIYHTGTSWWISSWAEKTDPFLLYSGLAFDLGHPLFFLFPFWLFFLFKKKMGSKFALTTFPFIFLTFEWLHSLGDLGYPWLVIGNTQISNVFWIQFIDITGIWGSSFLILIVNILILKLTQEFIAHPNKKALDFLMKNKKASYFLLGIVLILFLPYFYSFTVLKKYDYKENLKQSKNMTIGLVQPNINPWEKWSGDPLGQIFYHMKIADSLLAQQGNIDLLVWSETAIPFVNMKLNSLEDPGFISNWINSTNVNLITGIAEFEFIPRNNKSPRWSKNFPGDTALHYMTYNAAVLLEPRKNYNTMDKPQVYRKSKLTPFGELFPFKDIFPWLAEKLLWGVGISNWNVGPGADVLSFKLKNNKVKVGNIICIESIHSDFVRHYVLKGANIFTVITNDGWYDHTVGPRQHYLLSCIRAIENRRYIARVGNTGLSGFISPLGTSLEELPQYEVIARAKTLPLVEDVTFYSKYGDKLPHLAGWFTLAVFSFIFSKRFIGKRD